MSDSAVDSPDSLPGWIMPWPSFDVDWTRTGLLVIDYQNYSYNVIVVEDAVATFFAEHHRAALSALTRVYAQVWTTNRVLNAITQSNIEPETKE